jgi:hypothetical protein
MPKTLMVIRFKKKILAIDKVGTKYKPISPITNHNSIIKYIVQFNIISTLYGQCSSIYVVSINGLAFTCNKCSSHYAISINGSYFSCTSSYFYPSNCLVDWKLPNLSLYMGRSSSKPIVSSRSYTKNGSKNATSKLGALLLFDPSGYSRK